ncbi:ATP-binding protein [Fulvivirgaceae bacterium BMA10]|uniref:ATP-binding protein n=1 Tax=Splendidivirga corallicola TaxID=3051826 RepID=A0ABT8KXJ0_9BACT|nr:ATP-binding protein [Fulvivirgaceae bacterium BMA10]
MLVRIKIGNFLSFDSPREFNMLTGEYRRLSNHVYPHKGINILKFAAIYGANGSGKSNFILSLDAMQDIVYNGGLGKNSINNFKLNDSKKNATPTMFEIEIITGGTAYIYGFEINANRIESEWLYQSGLGEKKDSLIFNRIEREKLIEVEVNEKLTKTSKDRVLFEHYSSKVLKSDQLLLSTLYEGELKSLHKDVKAVWDWFYSLNIIFPRASPRWLLFNLINNANFEKFSNEILSKIDTGIKRLHIKTFPLESYFGEDDKKEANKIKDELYANEEIPIPLETDVLAIVENNEPVIKKLLIEHIGFGEENLFTFFEESDGTKRVVEYLVMLYSLVNNTPKSQQSVYIIDEIERSIHPCLIKVLLEKLSGEDIKGQLIFSTHESNVLDLKLFRPDEIWFSEKDSKNGTSSFYPLSEYEVRTDFNVRNGYLNGRFGAIPFLGDFSNLNWNKHAEIYE